MVIDDDNDDDKDGVVDYDNNDTYDQSPFLNCVKTIKKNYLHLRYNRGVL